MYKIQKTKMMESYKLLSKRLSNDKQDKQRKKYLLDTRPKL